MGKQFDFKQKQKKHIFILSPTVSMAKKWLQRKSIQQKIIPGIRIISALGKVYVYSLSIYDLIELYFVYYFLSTFLFVIFATDHQLTNLQKIMGLQSRPSTLIKRTLSME